MKKIKGTNAADSLVGTSKADKILALSGDDFISFSGGNDRIDGGEGFDLVSYQGSSEPISVNLRTGTVVVGEKTDKVVNVEMIIGTDGNDVFIGAKSGDSTFQGGLGDDTLTGGKGYDWADYYGAYDSVEVDLKGGYSAGYDGRDTLINIDNIRGSRYDDVLAGDDKDNRIRGMRGDDLIDGRGGYDLADYRNASGGVVVNLELGTASGADGNDTLRNMEGFRGSFYNDILTGDENDNFFESFGGDDELTGGAGSDRFSFSNGSGRDTITDFDARGSNPDIIELYVDTITGMKDLFKNHMAQVGDNVEIYGFTGEEIVLLNVKVTELSAQNFEVYL